MKRCEWVSNNPIMIKYHDEEWGVPLYDDKKIFEFLVLDCFQAGLSWEIVINKREAFRQAFSNFDPKEVSKYTDNNAKKLINNPSIIRNKHKIEASITNAKKFLEIQKEFGSFSNYIWKFVNHKPIKNEYKNILELPNKTKEAELMSKELKKRGFKFVGPTICYAFMQATGMVNDHTINCFRYEEV